MEDMTEIRNLVIRRERLISVAVGRCAVVGGRSGMTTSGGGSPVGEVVIFDARALARAAGCGCRSPARRSAV